MKLLTLLPPTLGLKDSGNSNWPVFAFYCSNHRYAAALAAQEVREARYKALRTAPGLLAGAVLTGVLAALSVSLAYGLLATLLLGVLSGLVLTDRRKVEIVGQSVECVVRRDYYGTPIVEALDDASAQLTRYKQFKDWPQDKIRAALLEAIPAAERWAQDNAKMIRSAV